MNHACSIRLRSAGPSSGRSGRDRAGFSLVEAMVAVLMLAVAMTTTTRAVSWILEQRRALDRRAVAIREAEHLLDRLAAAGSDPGAPVALSPDGARVLSGAEVAVDRAVEELGGPAMERIAVTVRYHDRPGVPAAPVRLTTWIARAPDRRGPGVEPGEDGP